MQLKLLCASIKGRSIILPFYLNDSKLVFFVCQNDSSPSAIRKYSQICQPTNPTMFNALWWNTPVVCVHNLNAKQKTDTDAYSYIDNRSITMSIFDIDESALHLSLPSPLSVQLSGLLKRRTWWDLYGQSEERIFHLNTFDNLHCSRC